MDTQVLIVGAGPVGLTLALDLGRRGVRCMLVERNETSIQLPKMERCNARTMEIFRRLGIADQVRAAGLPAESPMDVFLAPSMAAPALVHLPYPSVADAKAQIAANNDGRPLEPYQLISQYTIEPLLRSIVETLPTVAVRFGVELTSFEQDDEGVTGYLATRGGGKEIVRCVYLAGCDGGSSTVRKALGIGLSGQGNIRKLRQALFRCDDLYERIPMGKGRHYHIAVGPNFPFIILIFERALGMEIAFETLSVNEWTQHLLCADRYGSGRVFVAGDSAHLVIPTGGLGMNTGVGDAIDLSWKIAATLAGWGGPDLLASYETERRRIGLRNVKTSGAAMSGRLTWRGAYRPDMYESTPEAAAARAEMSSMFDAEQRKVTEILGIEAGYRYRDSPLVTVESGEAPDPDNRQYVPTTWPGARLPHVWLNDGSAIADRIGFGYTLLRLGRTSADTSALEHAISATGAPLDLLEIPETRARELYERDLVLVRPDMHVVWRGDRLPDDPRRIAAIATGHASTMLQPAG